MWFKYNVKRRNIYDTINMKKKDLKEKRNFGIVFREFAIFLNL